MCEDRRNTAGLPGRFGRPGSAVEMFDKNLVYAIIGGKDLDCRPAKLNLNFVLTRAHGSLLLELTILPHRRPVNHPQSEMEKSLTSLCRVNVSGTPSGIR
jgi:hypothetical protein